jgi:pilus assembly protein CpaB
MNQRFLSVLVFAFAVAAGASLLLYRLMTSKVGSARPAAATSQVLLAARNLETGTLIKETDLKIGAWNGPLPPGATLEMENLVGRGVISPVYEGEPLLDGRLAPKGGGAGLAAMIPQGKRAVAVRVNEVVGVGGFVVPGMKVDVLISGNPPTATARGLGSLSATLLQNIEVLSAGQNYQKDAEGKPVSVPVVNLLVTPEQAEKLSLASNQANIQLVLRNPLDSEIRTTPGAAAAHLFTGETLRAPQPVARAKPRPLPAPPLKPPQPAPAPPVVVEVIHGSKKAQASFREPGEVRP